MAIYTRGGDRGKTSLIGGKRRYKSDPRVAAYGAVDEAGAFLGLASSHLAQEGYQDMVAILGEVSQLLWDVGADLAAPAPSPEHPFRTPDDAAGKLEPVIDQFLAETAKIQKFVLRGGSMGGAHLHVACTVVRRAERHVVELMQVEPIHEATLRYLNRLSDLLFVMARAANGRSHTADVAYRNSPDVFR
jgi:cob(I)alamin adenosyltransferase